MSKPTAMIAAGAGLLMISAAPALAASSCACRAPVTGAAIVGSVVSTRGAVFLSQPSGMIPAAQGSPLRAGSRMITGPRASADIRVGASCTLSLSGGAELRIVAEGNNLCVRKLDPAGERSYSQSQTTRATSSFGYPTGPLVGTGLSAALPAAIPAVIMGATLVTGIVLDATQPAVSR